MNTIEEALTDIKAGKMIILVDDENRENEGDLVIAAHFADAQAINFMAHRGCGLICVAMEEERLASLSIGQMVKENTDNHQTAFGVSVDHVDSGTGISTADRALTVARLIDPASRPSDFRRPGHVFPLSARNGGALTRPGHTEAAIDLVRLAGLAPNGSPCAGVICEIMKEDGSMARMKDLESFAVDHDLKLISIADLIRYRQAREQQVRRITRAQLPTRHGNFTVLGYAEILTGKEHLALTMGNIIDGQPVLCRIHSECLTGDALGSRRCDCGEQYDEAMRRIAEEGRGVLVYLRQEGRGIGLINKIKAYALQDEGMDTVDANIHLGFPADMREYFIAAHILKDLGIDSVKLMTNNPLKVDGLASYGFTVSERIPITIAPNKHNQGYLQTKKIKMNHLLADKATTTRSVI